MKGVLRFRIVFLMVAFTGMVGPRVFAQDSLSASEILARADRVRFPSGDHEVVATVTFIKPGRPKELGTYKVLTKGHDKTLIETLAPASERGTSLLMLDRDLWVFVPDASMPVRISFQQRLLGDVANGDLARANFVGDYTPTLKEQKPNYYLLDLAAKGEDVTYNRILLAVEKKTFHPLKALFFAASGKLLKTGTYEGYKILAGVSRPSRLVIDNPLIKGQSSIISYERMTNTELPLKYFTKDYLKKLKY